MSNLSHNDLVLRIGGESGEGVITVAESVSRVAARMGLYLSAYRTFPAEIKGGSCMMQLRISEKPIHHPGDRADIIVAFNEEAIGNNLASWRDGGTLIYDASIEAAIPQRARNRTLAVPFHALSLETVGNSSSKNIVVLGVLTWILGLPADQIETLLEEKFKKRGTVIMENNRKALAAGLRYAAEHFQSADQHRLSAVSQPAKLLMTGNEAAALGSLAAGVDCFFGYPITPSSEIMEYLARNLPRLGGRFLQTEDEISAIAGVCGAAWTGKRAMTATSGPGLSLMSEIVGLLSMAEVPAVIVDSQRGGPSTGLPTKTEQSDLLLAVYGSHGEAPRIVLAPSTVRESFDLMPVAFDLADRYQMPVIVLMDQAISSRLESVDADLLSSISVRRPSETPDVAPESYRRFQLTATGISPRVFPGTAGFEYISTGLEHDEAGSPQYDERTHTILSAKRHKKLLSLAEDPAVAHLSSRFGDERAALGIACWGSTVGAVEEAVGIANERGIPVQGLVPKLMHPFVHSEWKPFLGSIEKLLVPEMNFTGQLATLLRSTYGIPTVRLNKLKGVPFQTEEILEMIEQEAKEKNRARRAITMETPASSEVRVSP